MRIFDDKQYLIAELSQQINSPLAAIRNALYLAGCRSEDATVRRYLSLADEEISAIAMILRDTRAAIEDAEEQEATPPSTRRAAA